MNFVTMSGVLDSVSRGFLVCRPMAHSADIGSVVSSRAISTPAAA